MKNLFQNKKILFTLILMASCLGILGVGGEGEAAIKRCTIDSECGSNAYCYCGACACSNSPVSYRNCDGNWNNGCENSVTSGEPCSGACSSEIIYYCFDDGAFGCKDGCQAFGQKADCWYGHAFKESCACPNTCAGGKCQTSSIPPATACESVSGQICCDLEDCRSVVAGKNDPKECSIGICCKEKGCKCEIVNGQKCIDTSKCVGSYTVITSGPRYCSIGTCLEKKSCKTETIICDCKSSCTSWVTDSKCGEKGCKPSEKHQMRSCVWNGCKSGDCDIKQCKYFSDCKTTTPNPCYWINIGCNLNDECDNQEAEICGPSSCKGNCDGKSRGDTRCVLGSNCNENSGGGYTPDTNGGAVNFTNPLSTNSFEALVMGIINWILGIVVSLAILFLIIGGLMYITSAGDEERIKKAKNIILYAVVGLGVVILSWSIITELKDILGVQ